MPMWNWGRRYAAGAVGGGYSNAETTAWVAAVSGTTTLTGAYVDTFISSLKSGGVWTLLDRVWILGFGGVSSTQALTDLKNLGVATTKTDGNGGGGTFTLDANGFAGDAAHSYIDTGYNPTGSSNFLTNGAFVAWYTQTNRTTVDSTKISFGTYDGTNYVQAFGLAASPTNPTVAINGGAHDPFDTGTNVSWTRGSFIGNRSSSSAMQLYYNETDNRVDASNGAGTAVPNSAFYIGARKNTTIASPFADSFTDDAIIAVAFGASLTATQAKTGFQNPLNALMTSLVKNVY